MIESYVIRRRAPENVDSERFKNFPKPLLSAWLSDIFFSFIRIKTFQMISIKKLPQITNQVQP